MSKLLRNYLIGITSAAVILITVGFAFRPAPKPAQPNPSATVEGLPTPDPHGCDTASDYTWCEPKQKCLRLWEEKCEGVVAATGSAQPTPKTTGSTAPKK